MKEKIEEFSLKNGIRCLIVPLQGMNAVTAEVFIKIGSKYETKEERGLSHFLEHMAFKGTQKRPSAQIVNREIDSKGAAYNASTSQELTSYYITSVEENMKWMLEVLADILTDPLLKDKEVIKERGVIIEEIRMYQDNPMMGLSSDFAEFMYGKSNVGCWSISGEVGDIEGVKRETVVDFRNRYLRPNQMVIAVAGDIKNIGELKSILKSQFEGFENEKSIDLPKVDIVINDEKEKKIKREGIQQGHFIIGWPSISRMDKRRYQLRMLELIVCGNSSSRLHNLLREKKGWAYYVMSASENFAEAGYLAIQSGVKRDMRDKAIDLVEKELVDIGKTITEKELNRAKEYLRGKTKLYMDRSDFWTNYVGQRLLLEDRLVNLDEELKKYQKVALKDIRKLANEILIKKETRKMTI